MKTNFIISSWHYWREPTRAQPLTQLYLATILQSKGIETKLTDLRGDNPERITKADIYFYTVASPDFVEVKGIVNKLRKKFPKAKHVAGGPHPTLMPNDCLTTFDSIVIGRGENALVKIVEDYPNLREMYMIPVDYSKEKFPFPRREFIKPEKVVTSLFKTVDIPSTTILFSHGCPYNCSFCANYNRSKITRKSNEEISEEIEYLIKNYNIKGLSLQDEICIPLDYDEAKSWANNIKKYNLKWRGQIRAGVDSRIIKLAKDSGCIELSFGLESVSPKVLKLMNKKIKISDVIKTMNDCKKNNIKTRLYLINGLPGEPKDIIERTKKFIEKYKPDVVLVSSFQPYPGCDIYNNPKKYGIEWIDKHWEKYNHLRCRFADSQDSLEECVPFKYEHGKGFTRRQIYNNLIDIQKFLIERGLNK
jgi:anaerobic magnesium-protoporphyrin IX monomethyl ester cyclase